MIGIMRGGLHRTRLPKYASGYDLPRKTDIREGMSSEVIGVTIEGAIGRNAQQGGGLLRGNVTTL